MIYMSVMGQTRIDHMGTKTKTAGSAARATPASAAQLGEGQACGQRMYGGFAAVSPRERSESGLFGRAFCREGAHSAPEAREDTRVGKSSWSQIHPAVDVEYLAGDIRGILVGEETDRGGDVLYLGEAAKRDLGDDLLLHVVRNGF